MVLCLGPRRSRQRSEVLFGPQAANEINMAAFDGGISTVINERLVLHVR